MVLVAPIIQFWTLFPCWQPRFAPIHCSRNSLKVGNFQILPKFGQFSGLLPHPSLIQVNQGQRTLLWSPSTIVPKMPRFLDSVRSVLYSALLIDQLQPGCDNLFDYFATVSQNAGNKGRTVVKRLANSACLEMRCLLWLPLLPT